MPTTRIPAGDEHDARLGNLLENLESHRSLAGDHPRVVERMDERHAALTL
jgi:hypothetical protein